MKSIGIIRRVDDLGRIVIPKEIRRILGITEGTPMELFVDGNKVVLQKYYNGDSIKSKLDELQAIVYKNVGKLDSEKICAAKEHIEVLKKILLEQI